MNVSSAITLISISTGAWEIKREAAAESNKKLNRALAHVLDLSGAGGSQLQRCPARDPRAVLTLLPIAGEFWDGLVCLFGFS